MRRFLRYPACVLASLHLAGCFSFHEIAPAAITSGSTVRLRITPAEALRQQPSLGELTTTVQGQAVDATTGADIGLTVRRTDAGLAGPAFNAFIAIPLSSIERAEQRRLDAVRTALLACAAATAALAVVAISAGGTEGAEPPDGNARLRLPLIRLWF